MGERGGKYLVNDGHDAFVYFVVQKVACTSIKTALLPLFGLGGEDLVREDGTSDVHALLAERCHQVNKGRFLKERARGRYRRHYGFAFVRNPWDRLLSCYLQKLGPASSPSRAWDRVEYGGVAVYRGMPFPEFAEAVAAIPDGKANPHFRSQAAALLAPDGSLMPDFVGRFENLGQDFGTVAGRLGLRNPALPHLTRAGGGGYAARYDRRTAALVAERYAADAEAFGYSF